MSVVKLLSVGNATTLLVVRFFPLRRYLVRSCMAIAAVMVVVRILTRPNPATWVIAMVWSAIGAFDALAAFIVHMSSPWPEFFMIEIFGPAMFFAAAAMHLLIIHLLTRPDVMMHFGLSREQQPQRQQHRQGLAEPRPS